MPTKQAPLSKQLYFRVNLRHKIRKIPLFPLTIMEAPMGYGKTTALRYTLKSTNQPVLWITIADNSETLFWLDFCSKIATLDATTAENLSCLGFPQDILSIRQALEMILSIDSNEDILLIIDDYHILKSPTADRLLELLIKEEPAYLRILIASRESFGNNTAELVLKGYCNLIEKQDFTFDVVDTVAYCKLCGIALSNDTLQSLYNYTEGWVTATYLCILNYIQSGSLEHPPNIFELIENSVYRLYPKDTQECLIHLCIFENFSPAQATFMYKQAESAELLQRLTSRSALITYNPVAKHYQIHNIILLHLRQKFNELDPATQHQIIHRAGEWFFSHNDYIQAMEYFYRSHDFHAMLNSFELDFGNNVMREHKEMLIKAFTDCPLAIKQHYPLACIIYARRLALFNEKALFSQQCEEIHYIISQLPESDHKNSLLGEFEVAISFSRYNSIRGMSEHHLRATKLLGGYSKIINPNGNWGFGCPSLLYMYHRDSGNLDNELQDMAECMPIYYNIVRNNGRGSEFAMLGEAEYARGHWPEAEIWGEKALSIAEAYDQPTIALFARFLLLQIAAANGDANRTFSILAAMKEDLRKRKMYLSLHTADLCEGHFYGCIGQSASIPAWIGDGDFSAGRLYTPTKAYFNIVYGKALLLRGKYAKIIGYANEFLRTAEIFSNTLAVIYTHIYTASAQWAMGKKYDAIMSLTEAINIAYPDDLLMPFVESGAWISPILPNITEKRYASFIEKLLALYKVYDQATSKLASHLGTPSLDKLTPREKEITTLVCHGLTNKAIASTLHIAEITVKKTLQNIYVKLGIKSRIALVKTITENTQ